MNRPLEPFSRDENPEQWAAVAEFEQIRADNAERTLRKIRAMVFKGRKYRVGFQKAVDLASAALGVKSPIAELAKLRDEA